MMRRMAYLLLLAGLVSCHHRPPKYGFEGRPLPSFGILMADSTTRFNTESIPAGKHVVLFAFEPWCPYCRAETEDLLSNIRSLQHVDFYMLCNSPFPQFKQFYDHFELQKYPNIHAGVEDSAFLTRYFKTGRIPFLAVYDKQKKLKQIMIGKTDLDILKQAVAD